MTLYIFRHALATHSKHGYGDDVFSARILPEGIKPIRKMGEYLKNVQTDGNFTSEFIRCRETADIITEISGKVFTPDARLNEFQPFFDPNPNLVEPFDSFKKRLTSFYTELVQKNYSSVLVCTHGSVLSGLRWLAQKGDVIENNLRWFPKTGVLVKVDKETIEEMDFNQ